MSFFSLSPARPSTSTMSDRLAQTLGHLSSAPAAAATASSSAASGYEFSVNRNGRLTAAQRDFYEKNGFIVIKGVVPPSDLEAYRERFVKLCNREVESPPMMTVMRDLSNAKDRHLKGEQIINKVQHFEDDDVLFSYCKHPAVLDYVESFIGGDIMSVHTMLINKPPHVGALGRHPLHQDLHYFPFRPANRVVCAWTAMERVSKANGCLVALPGTHKGTLLEHDYPEWGDQGGVNKMYHGVKGISKDDSAMAYLEMDPGDTVFFHPILIHGSGANMTSGYRKAISCHYASSECHWIDVKGTSQEFVAEEIADLLKKMTKGADLSLTIQDIFRYKSRLVRGEYGELV